MCREVIGLHAGLNDAFFQLPAGMGRLLFVAVLEALWIRSMVDI